MFDANEVINGLYGFVYDENGKQMQETKAFEANVDYDKEEVFTYCPCYDRLYCI